MKNVFISYSDLDRKKMSALKKAIDKADTDLNAIVIADQKKPLQTLADKVGEGIKQSDILIPILTSNSINNQWVNQEIGFAKALGLDIIPIIDSRIFEKLKGFIHPQVDCPFLFISNKDAKKETAAFRKAYTSLILHLRPNNTKSLHSRLDKTIVKQGEFYTTSVHFKGTLSNGFFDNYVQHTSSDFRTWNVDRETLPRPGNSSPGILSGSVDITKTYSHSTKDWPKGMYKIDVRVYDHIKAGEPGRLMVVENTHYLQVT